MPLEDRLDALEVARRRNDHPAGALHRFGDEGGDGVGAIALDQVLELLGQALDEGALALAGQAVTVEVRRADAQHAGQRQIEVAMHHGQPRQRCGRQRHAVVALVPADDLLLGRPAARVVVVAHELERRVVGFRPGVGEQHAAHRHRRPAH